MEKTRNAALVYIPPDECLQPIQNIRRKYAKNFRRWMPHMTLLYPFCDRKGFNNVRQGFGNICKSCAPFDLSFAAFCYLAAA